MPTETDIKLLTQDKPFDVVVIIGAGIKDVELIETTTKALCDNTGLSYKIIGDGKSPVTSAMMQELKGKLSPSTSINIQGHGGAEYGSHYIDIYDKDQDQSTKKLLQDINQLADGPVNCHLWGCYVGAAQKLAEVLGEGSFITTHGSHDKTTLAPINMPNMLALIESHTKHARIYKENPTFAALNDFIAVVTKSPETTTLTTVRNGKVVFHTARMPLQPIFNRPELERYLREKTLKEFTEFRRDKLGEKIDIATETNKEFLQLPANASIEVRQERQKTLAQYQEYRLLYAICHNNVAEVKKYITAINKGILTDININSAMNNEKITPLRLSAAYRHSPKVFNLLLSNKNIDVNKADKDGNTPLICAVISRYKAKPKNSFRNATYTNVIALLKRKDVDVNKANNKGQTALHYADAGIIKILIKKGVDVNKVNNEGATALHAACMRNDPSAVRELLKVKTIDINKPDNKGITPLMIAIGVGGIGLRSLLISNGAQLPKEVMGKPILQFARDEAAKDPDRERRIAIQRVIEYINNGYPVQYKAAKANLQQFMKSNAVSVSIRHNPANREILTGNINITSFLEKIVKEREPEAPRPKEQESWRGYIHSKVNQSLKHVAKKMGIDTQEPWMLKILTEDLQKTKDLLQGKK